MEAGTRAGAPELLERESESEQLAAQIGAAMAGDGSTVAVEGEAGIGKSALLAYALSRAREAGARVLRARGGELEQDFGYGIVRQLFDAPLAVMAAGERERVLGGPAGLAATALSIPSPIGGAADDPSSVLHGLYWLTANLAADRPLLIAVDDAHWADSASIAFLSYLARRVEGLALFVVYATRIGEGASEQLPATAEPGLVGTVLRPSVLSERATVALISRLLDGDCSQEFAHACRVATGGNPFLLHELLRALRADGIAPSGESCDRVAQIAPGTISRATLARLRRLGAGAMQLAFAIAVLGKSAELRHAAALADLDPRAAGEAADALTSAAILGDGRPLRFIHPVVRTTVYAEIAPAQRAASHKRAALLLRDDGVDPAELAPHLVATEPAGDPVVVRLLCSAAADVRSRGANEAACIYLTRAIAEPPQRQDRATVLHALGSAELASYGAGASGHLREALEGNLDTRTRVVATLDLASSFVARGRADEALELLDGARARIAAEGDAEAAMQLEGLFLCTAQMDPTTAKPARARLVRYEGRLRGESPGERLLLASLAFDAAHRPLPAAHAAELAELALAGGHMLEQYPHAANFPLAVWTLVYADRFERADALYSDAVEAAGRRGSLVGFAIATGCRCQVRFRLGRIADAEAEARSGLEAVRGPWTAGRNMLIGCVVDAMLEREELDTCHAFLAQHGIERDRAASGLATRLLFSRGHLRLADHDPAGALEDFEEIRGREARAGIDTAAIATRAWAALAHAQLGEHERARELAAQELARARVWGTPSALTYALRTAGTVADGEDAIVLLREAAAAVEHSPARYERARSLTEYGAALRRAGHRREAREPLREALELADGCGARRTAARARDELLASGARPRRIALSGADSLTPSERRVTRMAADGCSNRDIAQALFVTVRTVEGHLTQAYMKLDITSREQLEAALG